MFNSLIIKDILVRTIYYAFLNELDLKKYYYLLLSGILSRC